MEYVNQMTTQMMTGEEGGDDQTFAEYLQQIHFEDNPQILDDDLPEAFDEWLSEMDRDDILRLAEEYGARCPEVVADDFIKEAFGTL